jgi:putative membrane protein
MGFGGWLFMGLFCLVRLGVIYWPFVRPLRARHDGSARSGSVETPEEILDRRFARGEIDVETYQTQREVLAQTRGERQGRP